MKCLSSHQGRTGSTLVDVGANTSRHQMQNRLLSGLLYLKHYIHSDITREYCNWETFNATCPSGKVIFMTSAKYGRMNMGRCLHVAASHIVGCHEDIIRYVDFYILEEHFTFYYFLTIIFFRCIKCTFITVAIMLNNKIWIYMLRSYIGWFN